MEAEFVKIGFLTVDSGIIWLGDPCYILHQTDSINNIIGKDWMDFCSIIDTNEQYGATSFSWSDDQESGFGIAIESARGDGSYPVYARYKNGVICEINIRFDADHYDEEEEFENEVDQWLN